MVAPVTRRDFVGGALTAGALAGLGDFAFLQQLPAVNAADARVSPTHVQFSSDIEPLVKLLEDTDRAKILDAVVNRIRSGTSYQELLTAVLLAGVRGIKPRPVGFKFHAVLVINSANLASLAARDNDRWLPLLWAIDNYKASQAKNKEEGGWMMSAVEEGKVPSSTQARQRFVEAMDNWDEEGADRAVTSLVRSAGATEVIELFWRYGARDFRDIGHKAIYAANAWRALQTIGWRHAEPVMRSLAFAILEHEGGNPAQRDDSKDRPGRDNLERLKKVRNGWQQGKQDAAAATELLATLRTANPDEGSARVVELLNKGIDPACVWDGIFMTAGELLMRQPGIVGLHCLTSVNALHYGYQTSANDETRRFLMLQAAAFLPLFHEAMVGRGKVRTELELDTLPKADRSAKGAEGIEEILTDVSRDKLTAAKKTLAWLEGGNDPDALMAAARRLIFTKGNDSHDYKFSSAVLEDYYQVTPAWRTRYLATSMFNLKGTGDRDNDLIRRARGALA